MAEITSLEVRFESDADAAGVQIFMIDDPLQYQEITREVFSTDEESQRPLYCFGVFVFDRPDPRSIVILRNDVGRRAFNRCMSHELLGALGLVRYQKTFHTVGMPDIEGAVAAFSETEEDLLRILYDPRLERGMSQDRVEALLQEIVY